MSKIIYNSVFGKHGNIQISKNFAMRLVVLKLSRCEMQPGDIDRLVNIGSLGVWQMKCRQPRANTFCYGVIGPIGCDTLEPEIAEALKDEGFHNIEVKRIVKVVEKRASTNGVCPLRI